MSTTIHVGNLSFSLVEKDLEDYFSKYGKIVDSYIVRRGGRPRGYGFVEFSATKEADNALAANGDEFNGRVINIELAKGKIVKSNFQDGNNNYGGYQNNNYGGYQNNNYGGYQNNNYGNNGGYRNNNGGYRNNNYNREPRSFNQGGRTFYTLRSNSGYNGPRRNFNNDGGYNGPRRNFNNDGGYNGGSRFRKAESEKEKSLSTVYVSNLPFSFDEKALANLFSDYAVKTAHVVITRNGRSRGYGFVEFETEQDQLNAIKSKDQTEVDGRTISVKVSLVDKSEQQSSQEQTTN